MITDMTETRSEDMKVRMTAQETFEAGRAAQVAGVTSLPEFARQQIVEGTRRVLDEAERSECAGASAPAGGADVESERRSQ